MRSGPLLCDRVGTPYSLSLPYLCAAQPDQKNLSEHRMTSVSIVPELTPGGHRWHRNMLPAVGYTVQNPICWDPLYPQLLPPRRPSVNWPYIVSLINILLTLDPNHEFYCRNMIPNAAASK